MISLEKSIDYITIPAILLNDKKEIYSSNKQFNELFNINAKIEQKDSNFIIDIFVKAKDYDISLYEQITKAQLTKE